MADDQQLTHAVALTDEQHEAADRAYDAWLDTLLTTLEPTEEFFAGYAAGLTSLAGAVADARRLDALEFMARNNGMVVDTYYCGDFCLIDVLADEDDPKRVIARAPTLRAAIDDAIASEAGKRESSTTPQPPISLSE